MKIGIMTMQRIKNYGSFLQAYGLKKIIESLGNDVVFVDYQLQDELVKRQQVKESTIRKIVKNKNVIKYLKKKYIMKKFNSLFNDEYIPYLCGDEYNYLDKTIDMLVIGSDEVFNCLQSYPVGYTKELFGENYGHIPVISYAASFGQTTLERLKEYKIQDEVALLLKKFKAVSVRDKNSFDTVYSLTNKKPSINLDPVLIYDFMNENADRVKIKNYILVYTYPERLTDDEKKYIKRLARNNKKKIVSIGTYCDVADVNLVVNPFEVMPYFEHADFIITDTFHGSIFSVKTHSRFCTIIRGGNLGNNNKLADLLKRLGREDVIIRNVKDLEQKYSMEINYSNTDKVIEIERKRAIEYLANNFITIKGASL